MPFNPEHYHFSLGDHRGKQVIWVAFPKDKYLIDHLRKFVKARWSNSRKCWYAADVAGYRKLFGMAQKSLGKSALARIHPVNREAFNRYRDLLVLKAYSPNTRRTYCNEFAQLLYSLKAYPVHEMTPERLKSYCVYCMEKLRLSENQMHSKRKKGSLPRPSPGHPAFAANLFR